MGADCVLDAGNQFSAQGSYQECHNELYFEVGHSINKFKFSGSFWVLESGFQHQECSQHPHALLYLSFDESDLTVMDN